MKTCCFAAQSAFRGLTTRPRGLFSVARPVTFAFPSSQRARYYATATSPSKELVSSPIGYDFAEIEPKWQKIWAERGDFVTPSLSDLDMSKPKYYALDMFPYPSGAGLHVGHPEGYMATDIMSRLRRKQGYNVLHPMGWDAFGLPAEQYALQTGTHPRDTTAENVGRFRSQLTRLGFGYDWNRELSTTDEGYYRWTQWIFARLFERGLAYQANVPVNWCPALGTVLANEEVVDGVSERGGHPVERRPMRQWMLKITEYADRLLEDLEEVEWPESIKEMQRNWIGRSEGAEVDFTVTTGNESKITVYTTRPETIAGVSYVVVAPEWDGLNNIVTDARREEVNAYVEKAQRKSDRERTQEGADEKTGVFTGAMARCNVTGRTVPVWVADYVLGGYGTGAVMAVPAHDERDFEFATTYDLPIPRVIQGGEEGEPFSGEGLVIDWPTHCGIDLNGVTSSEAKTRLVEWLEGSGRGRRKVNYKLRDWLFSRQRYWGEPFPIVFVDGEPKLVPDDKLPVQLPEVSSYAPAGTGESPLATVDSWVNTGDGGIRETNTMPQWAGSCWYYLRFIDPDNVGAPVDKKLEEYWMPVDLYVGGVEHAVLHLLYARFWHKVLYDCGVVSTKEPFRRLVNQGMILGETEYSVVRNGGLVKVSADEVEKKGDLVVLKSDNTVVVQARAHKMSKSRGNVVNPDSVIEVYGADALRCYLMFMGPLEQVKPWQTGGVSGMARFLSRAWRLLDGKTVEGLGSEEQMRVLHKTIRRVSEETETLRFNTAIAALMEFVNAATKWDKKPRVAMEAFVNMLGVYAPHVAEEMWERLGRTDWLAHVNWPVYEEKWEREMDKTVVVQVNGKVRAKLTVQAGECEEEVVKLAMEQGSVRKHTDGMTLKKQIFVQDKLVNFVVVKTK